MRRTSIIAPLVALTVLAGCNGGSAQSESFHNGTFIVGTDIREGDYVTEGATDSKCTIEVTPKEGSGFQKTADKGEQEKITLESGEEVVTAGCEEFVRQ